MTWSLRFAVLQPLLLLVSFILLGLQTSWSTMVKAATLEEVRAITNADPNHLLILNDKNFPKYVEEPRDYALIVLFSVQSGAFKCEPCARFAPEYRLVADSWAKMNRPEPLVLAYIDFADGRHSFGKMKITTAPMVLYMPPTAGPNASKADPVGYDFNRHGMSAENFINFIRITQGVEVTLYRPIDWSKYVTTIVSVVGSLVALRLAFPYLVKIARNYRVWSALSLAIILMMTSGFMWNRIRHAQYIGGDGRSPMYIARGFQSQFGVETQIVAGLYAVCVFAIVALVVRVPVVQSKHKQLIILAISLGTLLLTYSGLLMLFRTKYMSYPFRLLL